MSDLPRGRIANDAAFEISDVIGQTVEELISHCCSPTLDAEIDILLLKVVENRFWYRFFLDAGCGFWEEWTQEDSGCDWNDVPKVNLASKWKLMGAVISEAKCVGVFAEAECSAFQFCFGSFRFVLRYSVPSDMESPTVFEAVTSARV